MVENSNHLHKESATKIKIELSPNFNEGIAIVERLSYETINP